MPMPFAGTERIGYKHVTILNPHVERWYSSARTPAYDSRSAVTHATHVMWSAVTNTSHVSSWSGLASNDRRLLVSTFDFLQKKTFLRHSFTCSKNLHSVISPASSTFNHSRCLLPNLLLLMISFCGYLYAATFTTSPCVLMFSISVSLFSIRGIRVSSVKRVFFGDQSNLANAPLWWFVSRPKRVTFLPEVMNRRRHSKTRGLCFSYS